MCLDVGTSLTILAELAIAGVIYLEFESARLDHFLEDASNPDRWKARRTIYEVFCGLEVPSAEAFAEVLRRDPDLKDLCDKELAQMSKIGSRLPFMPPLRQRVLAWFPHTLVFLWEILYVYVDERGRATGPDWARPFTTFTRACLKRVRKRTSGPLVLLDPNQNRGRHYVITREHLLAIDKAIGDRQARRA